MEDIHLNSNQNNEYDESEDEESSILSKTIINIFFGFIFIVLIVSGGIYYFIKSDNKQIKKIGKQTQEIKKNTSKLEISKNPYNADVSYSIKIPDNWERFTRASDETAEQIGLRPIGSKDIPLTINYQKNENNITIEDLVDIQYGKNYPREIKIISTKKALMLRSKENDYISYFISLGDTIYEISATSNPEYNDIIKEILVSLIFTSN
ncbi:MAG: hypothetical protein EXS44_03060 [Candidatus Levybacteria bacterium]|nr:hypothetical protein [Candidatus Levybacteria bacterium]